MLGVVYIWSDNVEGEYHNSFNFVLLSCGILVVVVYSSIVMRTFMIHLSLHF